MRSASRLFGLALAAVLAFSPFTGIAFAEENYMMVTVASPAQSDVKTLNARVTIEAPPNLVWQTITDYPNLKTIMPGYEKSTVLKSTGTTKVLDLAMKVAAFLPTYRYQVRVREMQASRTLKLERISGDLKTMTATYQLTPQDNGKKTLLTYSLNVDSGVKVPGAQGVLKSSTEKTLKALEKHIEAAARRSEIGQAQ